MSHLWRIWKSVILYQQLVKQSQFLCCGLGVVAAKLFRFCLSSVTIHCGLQFLLQLEVHVLGCFLGGVLVAGLIARKRSRVSTVTNCSENWSYLVDDICGFLWAVWNGFNFSNDINRSCRVTSDVIELRLATTIPWLVMMVWAKYTIKYTRKSNGVAFDCLSGFGASCRGGFVSGSFGAADQVTFSSVTRVFLYFYFAAQGSQERSLRYTDFVVFLLS